MTRVHIHSFTHVFIHSFIHSISGFMDGEEGIRKRKARAGQDIEGRRSQAETGQRVSGQRYGQKGKFVRDVCNSDAWFLVNEYRGDVDK